MKGKAWDSPRGPGDTAGAAVVGKHPVCVCVGGGAQDPGWQGSR